MLSQLWSCSRCCLLLLFIRNSKINAVRFWSVSVWFVTESGTTDDSIISFVLKEMWRKNNRLVFIAKAMNHTLYTKYYAQILGSFHETMGINYTQHTTSYQIYLSRLHIFNFLLSISLLSVWECAVPYIWSAFCERTKKNLMFS